MPGSIVHKLAASLPQRGKPDATSAGPSRAGGGRSPLAPRGFPSDVTRHHNTKPSSFELVAQPADLNGEGPPTR